MNKLKKVKAFKCTYCNMISLHSSSVRRHERDNCKKNLDRHSCLNCKYWFDDGMDRKGMEDEPQKLDVWRSCGCEEEATPFPDMERADFSTYNENNKCPKFISFIALEGEG